MKQEPWAKKRLNRGITPEHQASRNRIKALAKSHPEYHFHEKNALKKIDQQYTRKVIWKTDVSV